MSRCLVRKRDEQRIVGGQHAVAPSHHINEVAEPPQPVFLAQFVYRRGDVTNVFKIVSPLKLIYGNLYQSSESRS